MTESITEIMRAYLTSVAQHVILVNEITKHNGKFCDFGYVRGKKWSSAFDTKTDRQIVQQIQQDGIYTNRQIIAMFAAQGLKPYAGLLESADMIITTVYENDKGSTICETCFYKVPLHQAQNWVASVEVVSRGKEYICDNCGSTIDDNDQERASSYIREH